MDIRLTIDFPALDRLSAAVESIAREWAAMPRHAQPTIATVPVQHLPEVALPSAPKRGRPTKAEQEARAAAAAAAAAAEIASAAGAVSAQAPAVEVQAPTAEVQAPAVAEPVGGTNDKHDLRYMVDAPAAAPAPGPALRVVPDPAPNPADLNISSVRARFVAIVHKQPDKRDEILGLLKRIGIKVLDEANQEHLTRIVRELPRMEREAQEFLEAEQERKLRPYREATGGVGR